MPQVKFYYFNIKGLGESCRLLLSYGGEPFEDVRIDHVNKDEWDKLKPKTLYGQLPLLEIDGKQYAQSTSISRYLGKKYGIGGSDLEEDIEIDQIVDFVNDIKFRGIEVLKETDEDLKEKRHEANAKEYYPQAIGKLHEIVEKNNGHLALGRLTWADFYFIGLIDFFKRFLRMPDLEEKYPGFGQLKDNVLSIPKVKAFVDAAPKTDM